MGKTFWPVFVIVAALSTALTWTFAPTLGACLPDSARKGIIDAVRTCSGRTPSPAVPAPTLVEPQPTAPSTTDLDELPSRKGIVQADPQSATWGVLYRNTLVSGLDGELIGTVRGGRFFLIERRFTEDTLQLVGNFTPRRLPRRAVIPAVNLYCFTGSPNDLSERQRKCLRMYYELLADAEDLKTKLLRETSEKSPYYKPAAEALRAFRAKAAEVEKLSNGDMEANHKAKFELTQLRAKVQELNQKHKDWKSQHAAEVPDPEQDPEYQKIIRAAKSYAGPIGGMTY